MWQFSDGYVIAEIAGANVFCKVVFYVKATSVYYSERSMHCVAHIVFMLAANGRYPVKQNVNIWSIKSLGTLIVHRIAGKSTNGELSFIVAFKGEGICSAANDKLQCPTSV